MLDYQSTKYRFSLGHPAEQRKRKSCLTNKFALPANQDIQEMKARKGIYLQAFIIDF